MNLSTAPERKEHKKPQTETHLKTVYVFPHLLLDNCSALSRQVSKWTQYNPETKGRIQISRYGNRQCRHHFLSFHSIKKKKKKRDDKEPLYYLEWKDNFLRQQISEIRWQESRKSRVQFHNLFIEVSSQLLYF